MIEEHPTWIETNLSAVETNTRYLLGMTGAPLMAVVKADAYGHGAAGVGKAVLKAGASWLAVARYCEARWLRKAGITAPILVLGSVTAPEVDEAIAQQVTLTLHSFEAADLLNGRASVADRPVNIHIKVDTGMGRLGVLPDQVLELAQYAGAGGLIKVDGLYSHFAMADLEDHPVTRTQIQRFRSALDALQQSGLQPRWVHLANSAGSLVYPDARFNLTRSGSALLGIWPFEYAPFPNCLRPVFSWKARLSSAKSLPAGSGIGYGQSYHLPQTTIVGVIPVGCGDGYQKAPGNEVMIGGHRVPVIGRVCLDQLMVVLDQAYPLGEEVVLIGSQGNETISVQDCAARWKADAVEMCTLINSRVPRLFVQD